MEHAIIEGTNRGIEQEREIRGINASGFLKLTSVTKKMGFGNLCNTKWDLCYIRPKKPVQKVGEFSLTYSPNRDDSQYTIDVMTTQVILSLRRTSNWEKIINGEDIEPVPDSSH